MTDTETQANPVHEAIKAQGRLKERIIKLEQEVSTYGQRITNLEDGFKKFFTDPESMKEALGMFLTQVAGEESIDESAVEPGNGIPPSEESDTNEAEIEASV